MNVINGFNEINQEKKEKILNNNQLFERMKKKVKFIYEKLIFLKSKNDPEKLTDRELQSLSSDIAKFMSFISGEIERIEQEAIHYQKFLDETKNNETKREEERIEEERVKSRIENNKKISKEKETEKATKEEEYKKEEIEEKKKQGEIDKNNFKYIMQILEQMNLSIKAQVNPPTEKNNNKFRM